MKSGDMHIVNQVANTKQAISDGIQNISNAFEKILNILKRK